MVAGDHHALQESGRDLARDIKRKALTRKKTRIEEKLIKAKEKVGTYKMPARHTIELVRDSLRVRVYISSDTYPCYSIR